MQIITPQDSSKNKDLKQIYIFYNWQGYIKDYEGGTLVQCKVLWEINYLQKMEMIENKRLEFISKKSKVSSLNVLRVPVNFKDLKYVKDIPGLLEAKFSNDMISKITKKLKNVIRYILSDIRSDAHAWPFILPLNEKEVPDYYQIIKNPMDLSMIENKIENDSYQTLDKFEDDFRLIFKNCYIYNVPSTAYYRCANILEKKFSDKLKEVRYVLGEKKNNVDIDLPNFKKNINIPKDLKKNK